MELYNDSIIYFCWLKLLCLGIGLDVLEKFWKSFGNSLVKMCGNPVQSVSYAFQKGDNVHINVQ